jgi:hypothetical protein
MIIICSYFSKNSTIRPTPYGADEEYKNAATKKALIDL